MPEKTNKPEEKQNEDEQNEDEHNENGRNEDGRNKHQQLRLDRPHQANAKSEPLSLHAIAEPSRKRRGEAAEAAEAAFLARATSMGFRISKPWGECERYDLVIDYGHGRFYRIQAKCTELFADRRYRVKNGGHSDAVYTPEEIDFIAAHVTPLDLWYIVPIEAAGTRKGLRFYPHGARRRNGQIVPSKGLLEKYKNAWCLLDIPRRQRGKEDTPARCQAIPIRCQVCPLLAKLNEK